MGYSTASTRPAFGWRDRRCECGRMFATKDALKYVCDKCLASPEVNLPAAPNIPPPIVPGGLPESVQAADDAAALRTKLMLMEDGIRKLRLLREEYAVWKNGYADPAMVAAFKDGMTTMLNVYDVKITELLAIE